MAALDRKLQLRILNHLSGLYPNGENRLDIAFSDVPKDLLLANLRYLYEHRLIDGTWVETNSGFNIGRAMLLARGADFLADDGGLSAILGVVTVKLHDDTIRDLLIQRIEAAPGDKTAKDLLIKKIKALPADALGKLTIDGLGAALARAPDVLHLIGNLLS